MALNPDKLTELSLAAIISYSDAATLAATLNEAQGAKLEELLDDWAKVEKKFSYLNGKIAGYVTDTDKNRLAIRNYIRQILGLPLLTSETGAETASLSDISSLRWF